MLPFVNLSAIVPSREDAEVRKWILYILYAKKTAITTMTSFQRIGSNFGLERWIFFAFGKVIIAAKKPSFGVQNRKRILHPSRATIE